jgi:hypothetical protein
MPAATTASNNNADKKDTEGGADGNDESDDEKYGKGDGSPPAFATGDSFGDLSTAKPLKLNVESKPPAKSPYVKLYNVSS